MPWLVEALDESTSSRAVQYESFDLKRGAATAQVTLPLAIVLTAHIDLENAFEDASISRNLGERDVVAEEGAAFEMAFENMAILSLTLRSLRSSLRQDWLWRLGASLSV